MGVEPRLSPDEPKGDDDEVPQEHEQHEPHVEVNSMRQRPASWPMSSSSGLNTVFLVGRYENSSAVSCAQRT